MVNSSETATARRLDAALPQVHDALLQLSNRVAAFDVRSLEATDKQALALATCSTLAEAAVQLLAELVELLADDASTDADTSEARAAASDVERLEQVTYLARMEIERVLLRLSSGGVVAPDFWVHQGCSLYRKVWRGLCVVEEAVARALGAKSELEHAGSRATSLRVRRIYAWFRRSIHTDTEVRKDNVVRSLRTVGTRIATLIGKDEYGELRPDDRVLFLRLQRRILVWLASERPTFEEGRRIWEDCRAMADILRQVNLRADLIAHDAALARALSRELEARAVTGPVAAELFDRLLPLEGLDDELDTYLASRQPPPRAIVERVLSRADAAARSRGF